MKVKILIIDTSAIINGVLPKILEEYRTNEVKVAIPYAVIDELEALASKGKEPGFTGLEEMKRLRELCEKSNTKLEFLGERPSLNDVKLAKSGRIDALIIDAAKDVNGILVTSDYVQAKVAEAEGIEVQYISPKSKITELSFEKFFSKDTTSLHLKEGTAPFAKKGKPGKFSLVKIRDEVCTTQELEKLIKEISEITRMSENGFIEITRSGASVIQLGKYRIAITRPPFSDGLEITIVKPMIELKLEDYNLSEKLMKRLKERAEGILIAGPPGSGKTTFAGSLAEFYMQQGKIVKTLESPRDLQVGPEITQYGPLEGDFEKTAEILLLVRPDYSVFDEIRKTKDFKVFSDMRLAGVGMIGVIHSSEAINAIQRFIGRVELGMIPHIIDTTIFIKYGAVEKVYELKLTVKVPSGMTEADLARPVVEVRDFETGELEYEIYTYGEENVIVPVLAGGEVSSVKRLAEERILQEIERFDPDAQVKLVSESKAIVKVNQKAIPLLIGKKGSSISKLEEKLGIKIDVETYPSQKETEIDFALKETRGYIDLYFNREYIGKTMSLYIDDQFLLSAVIGKKSRIRISKDSLQGSELIDALLKRRKIRTVVQFPK
ncbi:MAG: PINc/VapC family ATPase [Candidatus Bathyarchaeia archaeon]